MIVKGNKKGGGGGSTPTEDPNTLTTDTVGKGIYLFSEGPVEGLSTGDAKSIYFNDVPLVDPGGTNNYNGVTWTFRNGLPDQDWIPGHSQATTISPVGLKVVASTPVVQTITGAYDAVNVTISVPALTFLDTSSGALKGTNLSFAVEVKTNTGSWVTVHDVALYNQKTTVEWQKTYRCDLPAGGSPWQVRVRRITPDSTVTNLQNDLYFANYATVVDGKFNYRNSCVLGLQFNAKLFQNTVPSVKAKIKGIKCWVPTNYDPIAKTYATTGAGTSGGIWDGTFKAAWTSNPIWIYYDLLINNRYGLGQDFNPDDNAMSAFVDKWSLYPIAQFCDFKVSDGYGGLEARYSINVQIADKQEAYDLLQSIMSTINGMLYFSAEQVVAVADMPTSISDVYTQADVVDGVFEYSGTAMKTRHSAVIAYFNDLVNLYKRDAVVYEDYDQIGKFGYNPVEINITGCTSRAQALRTAKWILHTEKGQTQTVTFKTGHRGGFLSPGELIKVFDDFRAGERMGGRVLLSNKLGSNITIHLDAPVTVPSGSTIMFLSPDGAVITAPIVTAYTNATTIAATSSIQPIVGGVYGIVTPDLDGKIFRVLAVQEEETEVYTVIALEHDDTKYAVIDAEQLFGNPNTSVWGNGALTPVTEAAYEEWYEEVSGSEVYPRVTISWKRPNDKRIATFELEIKTPTEDYYRVQDSDKLFWDSPRLQTDFDSGYSARIRSKDAIGRVSTWYYLEDFDVIGRDTAPPPVTNTLATSIINGFLISWDNPDISDFKHVQVWMGITNDIDDAVLMAQVQNDFWVYQGLNPYNVRYVWLRVVSHAKVNQFSSFVGPIEAEAKGVNIADFDDEVAGIPIYDILPDPVGYTGPPIVFLTSDQKLYTYVAGAWTLTVADIPDDFNPGIPGFDEEPDPLDYEEGNVYYNTTDGKLYRLTDGVWVDIQADGDAVIPKGATLPDPATQGDLFFLTTDNKLYRYNGTAWTAAVPANDITGTIVTTQIADDAITTAKIFASAITTDKINAGAITTAKINAGAVTATELAANSVTAGKIAASAVETDKIAANAITTAKINAGAVTANELAANSVTAGKIAAGAVTANAIGAGTITVAINLGSSGKIFLDGVNNRILISD